MDLALLTHLCQVLVPLVDSGSKGGGFFDTVSRSRSTSNSGSTTTSAYLLRTQSNQESLMRNKLPGCTSRRLHNCCPCMLLHDSVQLRCPLQATSHRIIYRRGGTQRWLLTSSSCLLGTRKIDSPTKFPWRSSGAGFLLYNRGYLSTGRPPACKHTQTHTRIHKKPSGSYSLFLR